VRLPHKKALVAADTGDIVGIVGAGYFQKLGENAYAFFNAMTDIVYLRLLLATFWFSVSGPSSGFSDVGAVFCSTRGVLAE
jgi:hypothetical protein